MHASWACAGGWRRLCSSWKNASATSSCRSVTRAAGWALAGALLGGALTYGAGARLEPRRSAQLLDAIPAISRALIGRVEGEMRDRGPASMLLGPLRGARA